MDNMEEMQVELWKDMKKYGRNPSWIVKRYGKYRRKVSWIVKCYENYGRKVSWIVKRFGKYRRKLCKDMEKMLGISLSELCKWVSKKNEMWKDMENTEEI